MGISYEIGLGSTGEAGWHPLAIGAGGWLTGLDVASDGEKVVRTDTYGAYRWNSSTGRWVQVVTADAIGESSYLFRGNIPACFEIRIAPSNTQRYYMVWDGYVYRTDNRGTSWTKTNFTRDTQFPGTGDDGTRMYGQKMAVDPADDDTVYLGMGTNGVWYTHDAGATWTQIAVGTIPHGTSLPGHAGIAFDPTSGTNGSGYTNILYIPSYGNGIWQTTNGGSSWSQMSGTPSPPTQVKHAKVGNTSGVYFCTSGSSMGVGALWKYSGGSWTDISPASNPEIFAIDPADNAKLVVLRDAGEPRVSTDTGATWGTQSAITRDATDIPWLEWTEESYMSTGEIFIDPADGKLYFSQGIGVWRTDVPAKNQASVTWTSQSVGIEQLVANTAWSVPGGSVFVTGWDRGVFKSADPDTFPSQHGVGSSFQMAGSVEHARNNTSYIVVASAWVGNKSGYSDDGGATWHAFSSLPSGYSGDLGPGNIAAKTDQNFVWAGGGNRLPYYTTNGGSSWSACGSPFDTKTADWSNYYYQRRPLCTDGTNFFMYHSLNTDASNAGVFSSPTGATWTRQSTGYLNNSTYDYWYVKLRAAPSPASAGNLFFTAGPQGGGDHPEPKDDEYFKRSTDGGATWTTVSGVLEVYDYSFGKQKPEGSYPTIFIVGYVSNVFGIWMSDDNCATWTRIGDDPWPLGSLDEIRCISGDMNTYGKCYVGFQGSGWAYYEP